MLRRRAGKDDAPSRDENDNKNRPQLNRIQTEEDKLRAEFDGAKVKQLVIRPRSKRRNGFIFVLGGLFGIFIALFFANQQEVISLESLMDLNLESLIDAIPQGIVRDAKAFSVRLLAQRPCHLATLCLKDIC
jgi:phospholipid:diacylglycerol acyltransferase